MNVDSKKSFLNDLKKITDLTISEEIDQIILIVMEAQTIRDIPKLRKLKGSKRGIYFRIRAGRYRIGVTIENDLVTFERCMLRKDFYKFFP